MKCPKMANTLIFKKIDGFDWLVKEQMSGNVQMLDSVEVKFMRTFDGNTNPYEMIPHGWSRNDVEDFLKFLKENSFINKSRINKTGLLSVTISLFKIKPTMKIRAVSLVLNCLLLVSFLPIFIIGCVLFAKNSDLIVEYYNYSYMIIGLFLGLVIGMIMHETGHAICGLSYGQAKVYEAGLILGLSFGAYVAINLSKVRERRRRIQVLAAGIEMNLLVAGVSFILLSAFPQLSLFFCGIGIDNVFMALINLLFISGLDGAAILDELLGTQSLFSVTYDLIFDKDTRKEMVSRGITGYAKIVSCVLCTLCQLSYPVLIILNILSMVVLFK